jgi:hypothetical protein
MTSITLLRLAAVAAVLAAPLAGCVASSPGAPYSQADQYKTSGGTEQMGAPGSAARD